jgi:hypothetical protein
VEIFCSLVPKRGWHGVRTQMSNFLWRSHDGSQGRKTHVDSMRSPCSKERLGEWKWAPGNEEIRRRVVKCPSAALSFRRNQPDRQGSNCAIWSGLVLCVSVHFPKSQTYAAGSVTCPKRSWFAPKAAHLSPAAIRSGEDVVVTREGPLWCAH